MQGLQADKEETKSAAGKQPSMRDRLQRAFHAGPAAFRPLRRLTVRHQDGGRGAKPADAASAGPRPAPKHSGPPVPAPPQPPKPSPGRVRLPAVTEKAAAPPGPPVPMPPPDVVEGMVVTPAADATDGDKAKSRVGFRVRKQALSSK
ncbi:unnamed protein product [Urochloa humidicola]